MISKASQRLSTMIDGAAKDIRRKVGRGKQRDVAEDFCRRFYANVPPDDLRGVAPGDLAGAALSLWQALQQRLPGDARTRAEKLDEGLEVITRLWSGDEVNHEGNHFEVHEVLVDPVLVQKPRIPIWVGGDSAPALRRRRDLRPVRDLRRRARSVPNRHVVA